MWEFLTRQIIEKVLSDQRKNEQFRESPYFRQFWMD